MLARIVLIVATGVSLSACVNAVPVREGLGGPSAASDDNNDAGQQTMASKVLGAIALERVTGRKPDPARLIERHWQ